MKLRPASCPPAVASAWLLSYSSRLPHLYLPPVVPFRLGENWNLITRTIAPVIHQPELVPGTGSEFGLGDINTTLFLSPAKAGKITWGVGPIFSFPTASDRVLGSEKWSAGPSAVALTIQGPWVVGALANNLWSYAGDDDRKDVNQFLFQYFINDWTLRLQLQFLFPK